jgi:hypothetical protein
VEPADFLLFALSLGVAAQVEFESRVEAKLKALHHVSVSSV